MNNAKDGFSCTTQQFRDIKIKCVQSQDKNDGWILLVRRGNKGCTNYCYKFY